MHKQQCLCCKRQSEFIHCEQLLYYIAIICVPKVTIMSQHSGQIVSEVHTFFEGSSEVKPLYKSTNQLAKLKFSIPKNAIIADSTNNCGGSVVNKEVGKSGSRDPSEKGRLETDEDGDLVIVRRKKDDEANFLEETFMFIEYENSTTLDLVGLQVWRGAFLLADFIIHNAEKYFRGKSIMEVGAGTGMTSIVAAVYAQKVIATDINQPDILGLIEANLQHNKRMVQCDFQVMALDFLDLDWSPELENQISNADVVLAADVVYHVAITEAFARTLKKILSSGKPKDVFIAMEKRYVFAISDLDVAAPMYAHFMEELDLVLGLSLSSNPNAPPYEICVPGTPLRLSMTSLPLQFPQHFNYERTKELVILHIHSSSSPSA